MPHYNFKTFKQNNYAISITQGYSFGFLRAFYEGEGIRNFEKVVLYFDSGKKAIAFQFTNDKEIADAFPIKHHSYSGVITSRSFFTFAGITKGNFFGKITPIKLEDEKVGILYVLELSKALPA